MDAKQIEDGYFKYADDLVRFAASIAGASNAEDLVAGVMSVLLHGQDREVLDVRAYLYRCVSNAAREQWRSSRRRERREALTARIESYEHHEFVPEVAAALSMLSPQQRAVVHLAYWEDLTPPLIATRLGVSDGTVRRQLARSRRRLKEVLSAHV